MSKINVTRVTQIKTKAKYAPLAAKPTDLILLHKWQHKGYMTLRNERLRIAPAPTGSGKSILLQALALHDRQLGYRCIISYPRRDIAPGFTPSIQFQLPGYNTLLMWSPKVVNENIVEQLIEFLTQRDRHEPGFGITICTHAALTEAHRRIKERRIKCLRKVSLFVDETHHSLYDHASEENNRLGEVITDIVKEPSNRCTVSTATFFRTEGAIIAPQYLSKFVVSIYHIDEYLASLRFLKQISIHLVTGPMIDSFQHIIRQDPHRKTIVFHPNNYKRAQTDLLNQQLLNSVKRLPLKIANLVPLQGQAPKLAQLTEEIAAEKEACGRLSEKEVKQITRGKGQAPNCTPDLALAFNMLQEGFNWPAVSRGILLAPRGSLVMSLQILGRLLRDWPGKENVDLYIIVERSKKELQLENVEQFLNTLFTYLVIGWQYKRAIRSVSRKRPTKTVKKAERILLDPKVLADILSRANKRIIANSSKSGGWDEALDEALQELVDQHPELEEKNVRTLIKRDFNEFWKETGKSIREDAEALDELPVGVAQGDPAAILQFFTSTVGYKDLHQIRASLGDFPDYGTFQAEVQQMGVKNWKQYHAARNAFLAGKTTTQVKRLVASMQA